MQTGIEHEVTHGSENWVWDVCGSGCYAVASTMLDMYIQNFRDGQIKVDLIQNLESNSEAKYHFL